MHRSALLYWTVSLFSVITYHTINSSSFRQSTEYFSYQSTENISILLIISGTRAKQKVQCIDIRSFSCFNGTGCSGLYGTGCSGLYGTGCSVLYGTGRTDCSGLYGKCRSGLFGTVLSVKYSPFSTARSRTVR